MPSANAPPLRLVIRLPAGALGLRVDPPSLAPWTAQFWATFPRAHTARVGAELALSVRGGRIVLATKAGSRTVSLEQAEPLWDVTLRTALRVGCGPGLLHAAVVTRDDVALVICGPSGSGKSTLARALIAAGWSLAADDMARIAAFGVIGVPRCIEVPPEGAVWAAPTWRYAHAPSPTWGHAGARQFLGRIPFGRIAGIVELSGAFAAAPESRPAVGRITSWLSAPARTDAVAVARLHMRPRWRLTPGPEDKTVQWCEEVIRINARL